MVSLVRDFTQQICNTKGHSCKGQHLDKDHDAEMEQVQSGPSKVSNLAQIVTDFLGSTCRVLPVPDALVSLHRQDVTFGATKTATS